ncbi:MAG: LamG-like jellyroll fold domain-containing protein, partial [Reichenbachiella sp.]
MFKNLPSRGLRTLFLCLIVFVFGSGKLSAQFYSLDFDGTIQNAESAGVVDVSLSGAATRTMEFWYRSTDNLTNQYQEIVTYGNRSDGEYFGARTNNGVMELASWFGDYNIGYTVPLNEWHHYAFTYDGSQLRFYVDGLETSNSPVSRALNTGQSTLRIGANTGETSVFGQIGDVRLWNVQRSQGDIYSNRKVSLDGNEPGLVHYYPFTESSGSTLSDITNGVDATLNNMDGASDWILAMHGLGQQNAINFDGVNDGIRLGSDASLQLTTGTLEAWVKTADAGSSYRALFVASPSYSLYLKDNQLTAFQWSGSVDHTAVGTVSDDTWHHVAMTFDHAVANGSHIYLDGIEILEFTYDVGAFNISNGLVLGSNISTVFFNGTMDEVMVWNDIRTPSEITSDAEFGIPLPNDAANSNLVAYYKSDQGVADADNSSITTFYDEKGINNGTFEGFTLNTPGTSNFVSSAVPQSITPVTNALNFDGSSDHVLIPDFGGTQQMTIEMWVNANDITSTTHSDLIRQNVLSGDYDYFIAFQSNASALRFYLKNTAGTSTSITFSDFDPSFFEGQWNHIAAVYDGTLSSNNVLLYVNGVLQATGTLAGNLNVRNSALGNNILSGVTSNAGSSVSEHFNGQMDEVMIWSEARSQNDIRNDATLGIASPGSEAGLLAYYKFDQGVAEGDNTGITTLLDEKGAYDGTFGAGFPTSSGAVSNFVASPIPQVFVPGIDIDLVADEGTYDFGGFEVANSSGVIPFVITNIGGEDLTITGDVQISGDPEFVLTNSTIATIAPGASHTFHIEYTPSSAIANTAIITINNDANGIYNFQVQGEGYVPNPSVLSEGSIAFSSVNTAGADGFSFMAMEPINAGTEIHFTDNGWDADGNTLANTSEGFVTLTITKNIDAGDQIFVDGPGSASPGPTATLKSDGSIAGTASRVAGSFSLSAAGDQILAFQGTVTNSTTISVTSFLAAIHFQDDDANINPETLWTTNATTTNESELPNGLTNAINAISVYPGMTISNNSIYDFSVGTIGSILSMRTALTDYNNWIGASTGYTTSDLGVFANSNSNSPVTVDMSGYTGSNVTKNFDEKFFPFTDTDPIDALQFLEIVDISGLSTDATLYYDDNLNGVNDGGIEVVGNGFIASREDLVNRKLAIEITGDVGASPSFTFRVSDGDNYSGTQTFTGVIIDNALDFDGDDYVEIQEHTDFELSGAFTIEFMFKSSTAGNMVIFEKGNNNAQYSVQQFSGEHIGLNIGSGTVRTLGTYNDGAWHHIAIVYRGVSNGTIYVDGEDDTDPSIDLLAPSYAAGDIHMGSRGGTLGFIGQLDELRVWNLERSQGDIQANMLSSLSSGTGLVAAYDFNSGNPGGDNFSGNTEDYLEDVTGNNHDGDLDPEMDGNASGFLLTGATSNWVDANLPTCLPAGVFTNSLGDNNWNDPDNWCGDVPNPAGITADIDITNNANLTQTGNLVFDGNNVIVQGGIVLNLDLTGQLQLTNNATFTNNGSVYFANGTILNDATGINFINNGLLGGSFETTTSFTNGASGTLSPGFSPSCMVFGAGYNDGGGTLNIEIAGVTTPCTDYDQVQVTGTATLSGTLNLSYFGGYTPSDGHSVSILTATNISGAFSTTTLPANWTILYTTTDVIVTYNAEGSSLALDGTDDYFSASEGGTDLSTSTIEMWVRQDVAAQEWLYWRGNTGVNNGTELIIEADGTLTYGESDGTYESVSSTLSVPAATWTHVAVVKENNDVIFFVNGESETMTTTFTGTPPSGEFTIGAQNRLAGVANHFTGQIDEVRIWNDKQADANIRTRATQRISSPLSETNLIAYYDLDHAGVNSTITDAASGAGQDNANDATLFGKANDTELSNGWVASAYIDNPQPVMKITEVIIDEDIPSGASSPGSATDGRNFGNVGQPSDTKTKVFEVRNDGVGSLNISQPTLTTGTNYSVINAAVTSFLPTESTTFSVVFAPTAVATYNETVNITNDYNTTYTFEITGEGVDNNALNFGGTDDYVSIGSLGTFPAQGTIELWVNASDLTTNKGIFDTDISGNGLRLEVETGLPGLQIVADDDAAQIEQLFSSAMSTSTWYHIAITWNTGTSNLVGYVNGVESFNVLNVVSWPANLNDLVIGTALDGLSGPTPGRFWNGSMDELRIWNVQRDQTQISSNMTNFGVDNETGLLASYDFNVGTAGGNNTGLAEPTLTDITTNTFDGTLTTFAKNGATSNYITSTVNASAVPEITVESAGMVNIDDNVAPLLTNDTDYGYVGLVGETKTFTIRNDGLADLSISTITSNSADWIVANVSETLPNELTSGNSMTFDVVMSPSGLGASNAAVITIVNNDPDVAEQNFQIQTTVNVVENLLSFDGADDNISITDDDALSFGNGTIDQAFSIEAWVNFNTLGINQSIVSKRGSGSDREYRLSMTTLNEIEVLLTDESAGGYLEKQTPAIPLGTGEWYHIAFTYDGSSSANGINIYLDGKLQSATPSSLSYTAMENTSSNLEFGQDAGLSFFDGLMDEVRIWDDVRSQSEIINNAGLTIQSATGLVASYDFNDGGTTNTLVDISGNGFDGTLGGFVLDGTAWVTSTAFAAAAPDVNIYAFENTDIADGDATPLDTDGTAFGTVSATRPITQTFTVENEGVTPFNLTGVGSNNGDFTISGTTAATVGNSVTFDVTYQYPGALPSAVGTQSATITATHTAAAETPYDFAVSADLVNDYALDFDGVDDEVTIGNIGNLSEGTIELWVKIENVGISQGIFEFDFGLAGNAVRFEIDPNGSVYAYNN